MLWVRLKIDRCSCVTMSDLPATCATALARLSVQNSSARFAMSGFHCIFHCIVMQWKPDIANRAEEFCALKRASAVAHVAGKSLIVTHEHLSVLSLTHNMALVSRTPEVTGYHWVCIMWSLSIWTSLSEISACRRQRAWNCAAGITISHKWSGATPTRSWSRGRIEFRTRASASFTTLPRPSPLTTR